MAAPETNPTDTPSDPHALALAALVWILGEEDRADRLLALTGLDATELRARADEPVVLAAVLGFLESHEPDLIACAADLAVKPESIPAARRALDGDAADADLGDFA